MNLSSCMSADASADVLGRISHEYSALFTTLSDGIKKGLINVKVIPVLVLPIPAKEHNLVQR